MSDFYSILKQSILDRGLRSARDREVAYAQARTAMVRRLWSYDPPLSEDEIDARIGQFDLAVDRIEDDVVEVFAAMPAAPPKALPALAAPAASPVYDGYDEEADYAPSHTAAARAEAMPAAEVNGLAGVLSSLDLRSLAVERALNGEPSDEADEAAEDGAYPAWDGGDTAGPGADDEDEPAAPGLLPAARGVDARPGPDELHEPDDPADPEDPDDPSLAAMADAESYAADDPDLLSDDDVPEQTPAIPVRAAPAASRRPERAAGAARRRPARGVAAPSAASLPRGRSGPDRRSAARKEATAPVSARLRATGKAAIAGRRGPLLLAAAVGVLGICLAALVAWVLWPSSPADPPSLATAAPPPPAAVTGGALAPATTVPLPPRGGARRFMLFDGSDPTVFEADPSNPVRFDGSVARISTSSGSAGARALVGPGLAERLAGRNVRLSMMVRSARENGAASLRIAYQSGLAVSHWQTVNLSSDFAPLELVWRIPALRTDPTGNAVIIEPGIPGDGTAAEIGAIAIDLLD